MECFPFSVLSGLRKELRTNIYTFLNMTGVCIYNVLSLRLSGDSEGNFQGAKWRCFSF